MKKKILYIHGWLSSGKSYTSDMLKNVLTDCEINCPDIPYDPTEALDMLKKLVSTYQPNIIIATSLGGFYANQLHGTFKILINPAFNLPLGIINVGEHNFYNPRLDGNQTFQFNQEQQDKLKSLKSHQFDNMSWEDLNSTYVILGTKDDVITNIKGTCINMFGNDNVTLVNFGHRLENFIVTDYIKPLVDKYDDLINPIANYESLMY
jgi:hypothetical protein